MEVPFKGQVEDGKLIRMLKVGELACIFCVFPYQTLNYFKPLLLVLFQGCKSFFVAVWAEHTQRKSKTNNNNNNNKPLMDQTREERNAAGAVEC